MPKKDYLSREEYNAWMRNRHARKTREGRAWALELLGNACAYCGTAEVLEFDHVDPDTKSFNIGSHVGRYSKEKLIKELSKCQLLCEECHKDKTGRAEHGTRAKYVGGCRCEACTEANTRYYRERRQAAEA